MTEATLNKQLKSVSDTTRSKIVNHLCEAYIEIVAAEVLLLKERCTDNDLPVPKQCDTLRGAITKLQKLFDFEN